MTLVCRDLDLDPKRYPPRSFSHQVSNLKNELVDHETFAERAETHLEKTLAEAYAQRFLLGLGVSHAPLVEGVRGHRYERPLSTMRAFFNSRRMSSRNFSGSTSS